MEVAAEKSGLAPGQGIDLVTNPGGGTVRSPVLDITVAQSTLVYAMARRSSWEG